MNVLDGVSQSYSHEGNPKLDQTRSPTETWDHEYVDSKVIKLFSKVYAFYEEEGHVVMDCPFVPFHIKTSIVRHVELQNVARTLMDQSQEQELGILEVQNKLKGMELGSQLGLHPNAIFLGTPKLGVPKFLKLRTPPLWTPITSCANLQLKQGLK